MSNIPSSRLKGMAESDRAQNQPVGRTTATGPHRTITRDTAPSRRDSRLPAVTLGGLIRYSGVLGTIVLVIGFAVYLPGIFLTETTFRTILSNQAATGILAMAALLPLAAGQFDLSFAAVAGLSLVVSVKLSTETSLSLPLVILAAIGCSLACGVAIGSLIAFLNLDSIIVTLGASTLILGILEYLTGGKTLYGHFDPRFLNLGRGSLGPVPYVVVFLAALSLLVWIWLEHTPSGRYTLAVGSNPTAARLAGRSVARTYLLVMMASSLLAGIGGVLLAAQANVAATATAPGYLLPALAALLLGATQVRDRANVAGTLIALILLGTGIKGLQLAGAEDWVTPVFNGAVLILAVIAASIRQRRAAVGRS